MEGWLLEGEDGQQAKYPVVKGDCYIVVEPDGARLKDEAKEGSANVDIIRTRDWTFTNNFVFIFDSTLQDVGPL